MGELVDTEEGSETFDRFFGIIGDAHRHQALDAKKPERVECEVLDQGKNGQLG